MKRLSPLVPGGLALLGALVALRPGVLLEGAQPYLRAFPYAVFAIGVLLGWFFNRSRIVFSLVVLALADRVLLRFGLADGSSPTFGRSVFDAVALLVPLDLAVLGLIVERGVLTPRGLSRIASILLQVLVLAALLPAGWRACLPWLERVVLGRDLSVWTPVAQPALLAFAAALLVLAVRFVRTPGPIEAGCLWALAAAFGALHAGGLGWRPTDLFAAGGLALVVALVETSYRMAYHDDLTGLPGRRALNEALLRLGSRYAVAMVDVDHFKKFNDTYGHDVGDQVLRMIASHLDEVAGGGKAFRYGGEEFSVLFPGRSAGEALAYLEALRKKVEASRFVLRGSGRPRKKPATPPARTRPRREVAVTISVGVADRDGRRVDPHQVIKAADKALYRAKSAGRNRVTE